MPGSEYCKTGKFRKSRIVDICVRIFLRVGAIFLGQFFCMLRKSFRHKPIDHQIFGKRGKSSFPASLSFFTIMTFPLRLFVIIHIWLQLENSMILKKVARPHPLVGTTATPVWLGPRIPIVGIYYLECKYHVLLHLYVHIQSNNSLYNTPFIYIHLNQLCPKPP
jgi:hypothetical protein